MNSLIVHKSSVGVAIMFSRKDMSPSIPSLGSISQSRIFQRRATSRDDLSEYRNFQDLDYEFIDDMYSQNQQHLTTLES